MQAQTVGVDRVRFNPERLRSGLAAIADRRLFLTHSGKVPYTKSGRRLQGAYTASMVGELMTLAEAIDAAERRGHDGAGVATFPGCGIIGVDFDHVAGQSGWTGDAAQRDALRALRPFSFVERSISGTGFHAITLGDAQTEKANGYIEIFGDKNFIALTGEGTGTAQPVTHDVLVQVQRAVRARRGTPALAPGLVHASGGSSANLKINEDVLRFAGADLVSLEDLARECPAFNEIVQRAGNVSHDYWWLGMGLFKHCQDGERLVHEYSRGHASYDSVETQAKFESWSGGPTTCAKMAEVSDKCGGCAHRGRITTPIVAVRSRQMVQMSAGSGASIQATPGSLVDNTAAVLAEMNARYFVAPDGAGHPAIHREDVDPQFGRPRLTAITMSELRLDRANKKVAVTQPGGGVKLCDSAAWWAAHHERQEYSAVGCWPESAPPPGAYNQWRGFAVDPVAGDVSPMLDHVNMLTGRHPELTKYAVDWCAYCVQHPGSRPEVALVFRGGQGTGKGTVFRAMTKIFGQHALHITQPSHLVGNFNGHLRFALFLFVDEGGTVGDVGAVGVLKGLITEPTLTIEQKGRDAFTAPNQLKIAMASNNAWVVSAEADERRFCVIDVSQERANDHAYFAGLNAWLDAGGLAAWLHYLLNVDLADFNPRAAPRTAALDRQKIQSMGALDRWLLDALDQGVVPGSTAEWGHGGAVLPCSAAVAAFSHTAGRRAAGVDSRAIGQRLRDVLGCGPATNARDRAGAVGSATARAWRLPGLDEARERAARAWGLAHYEWGRL